MNIVEQHRERVTRSQMDLDVGMLSAGEGIVLLKLLLTICALAAIGLLVAFLASGYWLIPLRLMGVLAFLSTLVVGYFIVRLILYGAYAYQRRLDEWHEATLAAAVEHPIEKTTTTVMSLSVDNPRDRLAVIAYLYLTETPPTVRNLRQRLTIERPGGASYVGEIADAERWGKELERRGCCVRQGQARQLADIPLEELLKRAA